MCWTTTLTGGCFLFLTLNPHRDQKVHLASLSHVTSSCRRLFETFALLILSSWRLNGALSKNIQSSTLAELLQSVWQSFPSQLMTRRALLLGNAAATKATFTRVQHLIVSASSVDHTLTSTWPQRVAFPSLTPTKPGFQAFLCQSVREAAVFPNLNFWLTTCWQNGVKPVLMKRQVRTCWAGNMLNAGVSCVLRVFPFQWKRKPEIFELFKSLVYPQQMCAGTPHSWV